MKNWRNQMVVNGEKVNLKEMFEEYARKELEFVENADPNKLYHRVIPNIKDKEQASIDFLYRKIKIGGMIQKDTIYLNKLKVCKGGKEEDIDLAIAKIQEVVNTGDMKLVNQL
ncbi:MAG: hypothetical protein J6W71_05810 [Methanobrevibacter sp.]|nr:hypothetical protein [Methanobrevibacter sp.]